MEQYKTLPIKISDHVWLLGNYNFNIYLLAGSRKTALIEMGVSATAGLVTSQLKQLDISPDYLVVTHPHTDHLTGIEYLQQTFPEAQSIVAAGALEFIEHPKAEKFMIEEDEHLSRSLAEIGIVSDVPPIIKRPVIRNSMVVELGMELDLGGFCLQILPVTGHSPGQLIAYVPGLQTLFPSDALGFHFPDRYILPLFFTGYPEYCQTIQQIKTLATKLIAMPHQGPITEHADLFLDRAWQATLDLYDKITSDERAAAVISQEMFYYYYRDEFTLYGEANIANCMDLLIKRVRTPA